MIETIVDLFFWAVYGHFEVTVISILTVIVALVWGFWHKEGKDFERLKIEVYGTSREEAKEHRSDSRKYP